MISLLFGSISWALCQGGQGLLLDVLVQGRIDGGLVELLVALAQEPVGLDQVGIVFQGRLVFGDGLAVLVLGEELVGLVEMVVRPGAC